ncbi:MAG: toxin-activating lysine-acyltransferase [Allosphingosinicella sp.]|uniref:toxin-activating lysine-acyltransferase n=1 Tax=Allosphingosinicella sp. TaxID=2823234 RepID=UPI00394DC69A
MNQQPEAQPPKTVSHVLGEITWLLSQSPLHKSLFISDLEWMVMPAILLEQFRIFYGPNQQPAGLVLWGSVSDETEQRLIDHQIKLAPQEWQGGDNLWLIEMVAPFGGQEEMLADVAATIFQGKPFKYQKTGPDGRPEVVTHQPTLN